VLALHGGGGAAESARRITCPGGDLASAGCMDRVADRKGFAVVYPNGTAGPVLPNARTWNAGGGSGGWQCVSGYACNQRIDDIAYFDALVDDLLTVLHVDLKRVYATGLSNGAAMSHRLACERANRFAAIAPVAGGNQFSTTASCAPSDPVAVLEIHGTADPCWAYGGGPAACAQTDNQNKIAIPQTVSDWVSRLGCAPTPATTDLPDTDPSDGTLTHVDRYTACNGGAEVAFYRVENGGHTWPGGHQYQTAAMVGPLARDFAANELMLDFFLAHARP
jgi:polyhydroxybutyrate depolymerase